jgi:dTDP-4-dehydrorhamnose reductase
VKILITGANGQLGLALEKAFSYDALNTKTIGLKKSDLDITDESAVNSIFAGHSPDVLLNCAAYTAVDRAESDRDAAFAINERGAANLAKACAAHNTLMVHFSTDYVFDGSASRPYVESDATAPKGAYAESKLAGERAVEALARDYLVLRLSWVYSNEGANFYKTMLRLGAAREHLRVVADQFGTPNFTGDLADALVALLQQPLTALRERSGIYHLSASGVTTWHAFAKEIFARAQLDRHPTVEAIATSEYPTPAKRPAYSALDASRFATTFGVQMPSWHAGLTRCLAERALSA